MVPLRKREIDYDFINNFADFTSKEFLLDQIKEGDLVDLYQEQYNIFKVVKIDRLNTALTVKDFIGYLENHCKLFTKLSQQAIIEKYELSEENYNENLIKYLTSPSCSKEFQQIFKTSNKMPSLTGDQAILILANTKSVATMRFQGDKSDFAPNNSCLSRPNQLPKILIGNQQTLRFKRFSISERDLIYWTFVP